MLDPFVGKILGQYEIVEKIATGGMATVYRARQESIKRDVAIKVLTNQLMEDPTFVQRFRREVEVIARLEHPRILPVFDYGEIEGRPYLVMPYLTGGTLADRIRDAGGSMTLDEIARMLEQIAEGLDYAHREGVIHRDLKPSNVLIGRHGNVHLSDFGIAKLSQDSVQLTGDRMIGTLSYMAPEMFKREKLTSAVDIYALGVTLFEMLTGTVPYEGDTAQVIGGHLHQPVPDVSHKRPGVPWALRQVIGRAMAKNPVDRFPTAAALAQAFRAAIAGAGATSVDETVRSQPGRATDNVGGADYQAPAPTLKDYAYVPPYQGEPPEGSASYDAPAYGAPPYRPRRSTNWPLMVFAAFGAIILLLACGFIAFLLLAPDGPITLASLMGGGTDEPTREPDQPTGEVVQPTDEPTGAPTDAPTEAPTPTETIAPTWTLAPDVDGDDIDDEAIAQAVLDFDAGMRYVLETGDTSRIGEVASGKALEDRLAAANTLATAPGGPCFWDYSHRGLEVKSIRRWDVSSFRVEAEVDRDGAVFCRDGERPEYAFEGPYMGVYIVAQHGDGWIVTGYCPATDEDCLEELE